MACRCVNVRHDVRESMHFITFGAWLDDQFGFGALGIAAVGFSFGLVELYASVTSANKTDSWGKEISIAIGCLIMVPGGLALSLAAHNLIFGLLALMIYILGFEFAVVSMLPLATHLVPKRPGSGLGLVIGAGTLGRGVMSLSRHAHTNQAAELHCPL